MDKTKVSPDLLRDEQIKLMKDDETILPREFRNALDRILSGQGAITKEYESAFFTLKTLLDSLKETFTVQAALRLLEVVKSGALQDERQEFQDTFIVVTVLPPTAREHLRFMFPQGYLKYVESLGLDRLYKGQALANWVICFQPVIFAIHLQYFSAIGKDKPLTIFAQDLLEPHERIKYLGADPWIR